MSEEEVNTLFKHTYNNDFLDWANPRLTSRSGFHSFYDGIKGLLEMAQHYEKDKEVLIGLIVDWLIETEIEASDLYYDLEFEIIYNELQN